MSIRSFGDKHTQEFFETGRVNGKLGWASIKKIVVRKIDMIHYAVNLSDLRAPPYNKLEALKADLKGFHSIRVNDQWRIIFRWTKSGVEDVEVIDYHD